MTKEAKQMYDRHRLWFITILSVVFWGTYIAMLWYEKRYNTTFDWSDKGIVVSCAVAGLSYFFPVFKNVLDNIALFRGKTGTKEKNQECDNPDCEKT